jgi:hypothetical protein
MAAPVVVTAEFRPPISAFKPAPASSAIAIPLSATSFSKPVLSTPQFFAEVSRVAYPCQEPLTILPKHIFCEKLTIINRNMNIIKDYLINIAQYGY